MAMNFIWIKVFYDFYKVVFSTGYCRKTGTCFFKRISRKFACIVDYNALFSKEIVKDLSFVFEIYNLIFILINWWNTSYF